LNNNEGVTIGNETELQWVAYLLQVDQDDLKSVFTTKTTVNFLLLDPYI